jgi:transcriptional regulator with XRE-family HTH domain
MSILSANLTARRESLGLSVTDVHARLEQRGVEVAYSTVAGWFNGSRGVRGMENLKALCAVLETDMNTLTGDDIEVVEGKVEVTVARAMRELEPMQQEAVLALIRAMRPPS